MSILDFISMNKTQKKHCTHTKYTIYVENKVKDISNIVLN